MSIYSIEVTNIRGERFDLSDYKGKVVLIVNTASKCGFTPQYQGLQKLYEKHKSEGVVILGFPCNQFMNQEPGTNLEIIESCSLNYGVTFPMFDKVDVNGKNQHPLYRYLTREAPGLLGSKSVKWNFTKFLVDRKGRVVQRFAPTDTPEQIEPHIRALLVEG